MSSLTMNQALLEQLLANQVRFMRVHLRLSRAGLITKPTPWVRPVGFEKIMES